MLRKATYSQTTLLKSFKITEGSKSTRLKSLMMTIMCNPKALLLVLLITEAVMSIPLPKSKRRRKPHAHNHRHPLLKVYNFSHSALKLKTPTNSRQYVIWSKNAGVYLQANRNLTPGTNRTEGERAEFTKQMMAPGIVRLKNTITGRYLAINGRGRLLLQRNPNDDCLFLERYDKDGYNTYASYKYYKKSQFDVYIGVKMLGDIKSPLATAAGQKAIIFNTWPR